MNRLLPLLAFSALSAAILSRPARAEIRCPGTVHVRIADYVDHAETHVVFRSLESAGPLVEGEEQGEAELLLGTVPETPTIRAAAPSGLAVVKEGARASLPGSCADYFQRRDGAHETGLSAFQTGFTERSLTDGIVPELLLDRDPAPSAGEISVQASTPRSILILRITASDGAPNASAQALRNVWWNNSKTVNGLYLAASYGQISFREDSNGDGIQDVLDVTVTASKANCNYSTLGSQARTAAQGLGINPNSFQHRQYVIPAGAGCGWAGLASVGGGDSWIVGEHGTTVDVVAHEIGHNLGLLHASKGGSEYGDHSCLMGIGGIGYRYFNGPHERQLGVLGTAEQISVTSGTQTVRLAAIEKGPADDGAHLLVTVPKVDTAQTYYLSCRQKAVDPAYSSNLGSSFEGVAIHTQSGSSGNTNLVTTLNPGATFTDSGNGIVITYAGGATPGFCDGVQIHFTGSGPTLTPTPTRTATRSPTATRTLTATATAMSTSTPTRTATRTPTATRTVAATSTPLPTATPIPSVTPSRTATPVATHTGTALPTATVTSTPTVTSVPVQEPASPQRLRLG